MQNTSKEKEGSKATMGISKLLFLRRNELKLIQASGERPQRSTRGKGGARAQLASVAERIRPDLNPGVKRPRTKDIPTDVPLNAMAPPTKHRRGV